MSNAKLVIGLFLTLYMSGLGCVGIGSPTGFGPNGGIFQMTNSGTYASTGKEAEKQGSACIHRVLFLFTFGGNDAATIAERAGITKITSVERSGLNILTLIYSNQCSKVRGF